MLHYDKKLCASVNNLHLLNSCKNKYAWRNYWQNSSNIQHSGHHISFEARIIMEQYLLYMLQVVYTFDNERLCLYAVCNALLPLLLLNFVVNMLSYIVLAKTMELRVTQ